MTSSVEAACQCCEFEVDGTVRNFSEVSVGILSILLGKCPDVFLGRKKEREEERNGKKVGSVMMSAVTHASSYPVSSILALLTSRSSEQENVHEYPVLTTLALPFRSYVSDALL